jgi:DNA-binding FrmR family transcriptional regulator
MVLTDPQVKEKMTSRLRRIKGQVNGVEKMIEDGRDCREIIQQMTAIRAAVQAASVTFLQEAATECLLNLDLNDRAKSELLLQDMLALVGKA